MLLTLRFADEVLPRNRTSNPHGQDQFSRTVDGETAGSKHGRQILSRANSRIRTGRILSGAYRRKYGSKETHSLDVEEPASDERPKAQVIDLMAALKASLEKSGRQRRARGAARKPSKTRKRA
jgi:hypothetical protein